MYLSIFEKEIDIMRKSDRVCVSRYYPVDHIKANRMYIVQYDYSMFIANGNIYVTHHYNDENNEMQEKYFCCTIHNFKKWGGIENLKRFVSLKGKKEMNTIIDLMDAVIECGYSRELDYFEYRDIENDSLLENSDYKYDVTELSFHTNENLSNGFEKLESPRYGLQIGKFNDTQMNFCMDLGIGGIRKDLPECVLKEIERETNELLEANIINHEDIKKVKFTCYAKVQLHHNYHYDGTIKNGKPQNNNYHVFYRSYSIHIEIDKIGDYYKDFDLDNLDMKFLKHADFCLCDRSWTEKPFDEFIKNEMFNPKYV